MLLKDYLTYSDETYNYWYNVIMNDATLDDTTKTDLVATLSDSINTFKTACTTYKSNFPVSVFKKLLLSLYTYYKTGISRYIDGVTGPVINDIREYIYWYTYTLPDYTTLYSIVETTDPSTGLTTYVLDTTNMDNLISDINTLDDAATFDGLIGAISSYNSDISIALTIGNKTFKINKNAKPFDEIVDYKTVCNEFGFTLPGVNF